MKSNSIWYGSQARVDIAIRHNVHSGSSMHSRSKAYDSVYSATHDHKAAVGAYVAGNVHATENAKATGNL